MTDSFDEQNGEELYKSKTQVKQEMLALQQLGEALIKLPEAVYATFPIPEDLDNAIQEARRIKSNNALKRQMQYIGKIMRRIEAEPIETAYNEWKDGRKKMAREHHKLEETRDELVAGNKDSLNKNIEEHPDCDIQQLRQLIRGAHQERSKNKPPKNYRKLFQFLKEL